MKMHTGIRSQAFIGFLDRSAIRLPGTYGGAATLVPAVRQTGSAPGSASVRGGRRAATRPWRAERHTAAARTTDALLAMIPAEFTGHSAPSIARRNHATTYHTLAAAAPTEPDSRSRVPYLPVRRPH